MKFLIWFFVCTIPWFWHISIGAVIILWMIQIYFIEPDPAHEKWRRENHPTDEERNFDALCEKAAEERARDDQAWHDACVTLERRNAEAKQKWLDSNAAGRARQAAEAKRIQARIKPT